jgi:hypothetical protein
MERKVDCRGNMGGTSECAEMLPGVDLVVETFSHSIKVSFLEYYKDGAVSLLLRVNFSSGLAS